MKSLQHRSLVYLVGAYLAAVTELRCVQVKKALLKRTLLARLHVRKPIVVNGWRLLKGWRAEQTGWTHYHRPGHWELDVRKNTHPLHHSEKP